MTTRGTSRREDLDDLRRLLRVVESAHAARAAQGADTTHAAHLLAKLQREHATLACRLGALGGSQAA